jgi:hypothetical protein
LGQAQKCGMVKPVNTPKDQIFYNFNSTMMYPSFELLSFYDFYSFICGDLALDFWQLFYWKWDLGVIKYMSPEIYWILVVKQTMIMLDSFVITSDVH